MAGSGSALYEDGGADTISDINVTPLVDVALVLLIIFMVTAPLIASRGVSVEKPKTVTGSQVSSTLTITLDRDQVLYINGTAYEDLDLARKAIEAESELNPEIKAIIQADKEVPHGEVMQAIDLVTLGGVSKFALASAPKEPKDAD